MSDIEFLEEFADENVIVLTDDDRERFIENVGKCMNDMMEESDARNQALKNIYWGLYA